MLAYGSPILGIAVFVASLGVPLPAGMMLLAGGAFVRQGDLHWSLAIPLALLGAVGGDSGSYLMGRFGGALLVKRIQGHSIWRGTQANFERHGSLAIWLSRFLLTPLALPTNLIAGSSRYSFARFVGVVMVGEIIWVALYGGVGYLFYDSWELVNDLIGDLIWLLVGVIVLGAGTYLAVRLWRQRTAARIPS